MPCGAKWCVWRNGSEPGRSRHSELDYAAVAGIEVVSLSNFKAALLDKNAALHSRVNS